MSSAKLLRNLLKVFLPEVDYVSPRLKCVVDILIMQECFRRALKIAQYTASR